MSHCQSPDEWLAGIEGMGLPAGLGQLEQKMAPLQLPCSLCIQMGHQPTPFKCLALLLLSQKVSVFYPGAKCSSPSLQLVHRDSLNSHAQRLWSGVPDPTSRCPSLLLRSHPKDKCVAGAGASGAHRGTQCGWLPGRDPWSRLALRGVSFEDLQRPHQLDSM